MNTHEPLVSLLMPTYNTVQFLKAAVDSVKKQTYTNWELIMVDDGSVDGSNELASVLATTDKRIKHYTNPTNLGISKTRRKGVDESSGELIGHIDSDDLLERWAVEEMVTAFNAEPDVALFYSDFAHIDVENAVGSYSPSKVFDSAILHQHGWRHFGMYRRSAYDQTEGFNTKLIHGCEDGDLFMQIAEKYPCKRIQKVLYFYRNHAKNTTRKLKKCDVCTQRADCNYMRVWAKSAKYDPITFKPLNKEPVAE